MRNKIRHLPPAERTEMKQKQKDKWGKIIGERIEHRMRNSNPPWSPTVLAVRAGCSPTTIRNALQGNLIRLDVYYDIATALGIAVGKLIQVPPGGLD